MSTEVPEVTLDGPLDLNLPNGSTVRVRPGPYGKGLAVVHVRVGTSAPRPVPDGTGRPGRKPRESTVRLREKLQEDHANDELQASPHYVRWLLEQDPHVDLAVARQTVYRERKRVL